MSAMVEKSKYVSIDEAASILDVAPRTVRRWIAEGIIQGYQRLAGRGSPRLLREDVERLNEFVPIRREGDQDGA